MTDVKNLTHEEKVFLAGSIRDLILEDETIAESELDDLDSLSRRIGFDDYEKYLDEFVEKIPDEQAFTTAARKIVRPEAQQVILETLYEIQLHKSLPESESSGVFGKLTALWPATV